MTLAFWLIVWAMTLLVLSLLLWPLLKRQESTEKGDGEKALWSIASSLPNWNDDFLKRQGLPRQRLQHGSGR